MKTIKVKKGQILQRIGDLDSKVYVVNSGLLRSYTIDEKGKEHVFLFAPEDWIIADVVLPIQPCQLFIDALEDSSVTVFEKDLKISMISKEKFRNRIAVMQNRIIMLMSESAWQRYQHFVETYPDIVQRVPQKMIASYLGITPEALSKLRRRRNENK